MRRGLLPLLMLLAVPPLRAQAPDPPTRAYDLERRGRYLEAAQLYREILAGRPADVGALLGLERTLTSVNRLPDMVPQVADALARGESSAALQGIAIRVYTAAGRPDSVRAAVDRWAALEPRSEGPYQEWGAAALGVRDRALARDAYALGRQRLGDDALAGELAQLATVEGDYDTAVREWMTAVRRVPGHRSAAISMLSQTSPASRAAVLRLLDQTATADAQRIAAALTMRWGDPVGGVRRLERAAPRLGDRLVEALQEGLDELRGQRGREALMARAVALELLAQHAPDGATRFRLEAAQAYADAGDQQSARRMLSRLAGDPKASPAMAASATSTLVSVLVAEGKMEEATRQLAQLEASLSEEERQQLARRVAEGWIARGELERAASQVAGDSTVEGLAVRGRIRLYQGSLGDAGTLLRQAGPFAGERREAVSRTQVLSLLQVIDGDSLPLLGSALLALERGDSAAAARDLERVAGQLPAERGGAEIRLLSGRVYAGLRDAARAEAAFRAVAGAGVAASAAEAELEIGKLLLARNERPGAIEVLEHLLVTYPASAVVPQARRLRDVARGAVPPV